MIDQAHQQQPELSIERLCTAKQTRYRWRRERTALSSRHSSKQKNCCLLGLIEQEVDLLLYPGKWVHSESDLLYFKERLKH